MIRNWAVAFAVAVMLIVPASAGTISGRVAGVNGESVVYVDTIAGKTFPAPADHPLLDQKGLTFQPHILVVLAGTTVDFRNSDSVAHNTFWPAFMQNGKKTPGKNLGTWVQGDKRSFKFDQPGVAAVLCNVHPEMSGYIVVVPTPYYAVTDKMGNFKINDVPDGQYNVVGWHEGAKQTSKAVAVSGDAKADFALSK